MIVVNTGAGKVVVNPEYVLAIIKPDEDMDTCILLRDDARVMSTDSVEEIWKLIMVE